MGFIKLKENKKLVLLGILIITVINIYLLTRPGIVIGLSVSRSLTVFLATPVFIFLILATLLDKYLTKQNFINIFSKKELYLLITALFLLGLNKVSIINNLSNVIAVFLSYMVIALFLTFSLSFLNNWFKKIDSRLAKISLFILAGLILIFVIVYTRVCFLRFDAGLSSLFDLGNMEQTVWNTLHGNFFRMTTVDGLTNRLGVHADVFLVLLAPFYALWPSPKMLIFAQTLILGLGALPLFLIAKKLLKSSAAGLIFAFAYLISPVLGAAAKFDFHSIALVTPFLFFAFYFLLEKQYIPYFIFIILALTCKEEVSLLILLFGIYVYFKHNKKVGMATFLLGLTWFISVFFFIMPHFRQGDYFYFSYLYGYLGNSRQEIIKSLITRPDLVIGNLWDIRKLVYVLYLILPLGGLVLFSPFVLLGIPSFAINTLTDYEQMFSGGFHYSAPLLFYLIIGSIFGIKFWLKKLKKYKVALLYSFLIFLFFSSLFFGYRFRFMLLGPQLGRSNEPIVVSEHAKKINEVKGLVPPDASVEASWELGVYLAGRKNIYTFPTINKASYIVLEQPGWSWDPMNKEDYKKAIDEFRKNKDYQVIYDNDDYFIAKRRQ